MTIQPLHYIEWTKSLWTKGNCLWSWSNLECLYREVGGGGDGGGRGGEEEQGGEGTGGGGGGRGGGWEWD